MAIESRPPKRWRGNSKAMRVRTIGVPHFLGDLPATESRISGRRGRLRDLQGQVLPNYTKSQRLYLLRKARISLRAPN